MVWLLVFLISTAFADSIESPRFEIVSVVLDGKKRKVFLADTNKKREYGMMFRESWGDAEGMLFVFPNAKIRNFWMKNTILPLSIGFFDSSGGLQEMQDLRPARSILDTNFDRAISKKPAKYVLEVPLGWFKKNKIQKGSRIKLLPSLAN